MRREDRRDYDYERQAPCVHERETGGRALSPMVALHSLAHTAFGIRGGQRCAMVLDLVMG